MGEKISELDPAASINDTDEFVAEVVTPNDTLKYAWSLIKSTLKTYFDSLYQPLGGGDPTSSTKTGNYTVLDDDGFSVIILSGASGNSVFTLPTLADNLDREITLFNNDTTYELNVDGEGAETIDGMTDIDLPKQGNYLKLKALSTGWLVLDESIRCTMRFDTYAGYGSTDNKIIRLTNNSINVGNLITENHTSGYNSNTEGLEITIVKSGRYGGDIQVSQIVGGYQDFGFSLNSTQLTTSIATLNIDTVLPFESVVNGGWGTASFKRWLDVGDIVRFHSGGAAASNTTFFQIEYIGK